MLAGDRGSEVTAVARAAGRGLALSGLGRFRYVSAPTDPGGLVVGYGTPPGHAFSGALEALCATLG